MKIAHVSPEYYPAIGGVGQVVRELAERQAKAGHEVHVFTPDWDKKSRIKKREDVINGVHIHRCFYIIKVANFNTLWPSVLFRLVSGKFDIIHSHNFGHVHAFLSAIASLVSRAKHIHTTHCPWSDAQRSLAGRLGILISYNIFSRLVLSTASAVIAITPWEINFIKKYGGKKDKIKMISNGMGSEFFVKIKNNDFKKANNLKEHVVLFFGRLNKTKSPDDFVRIAKQVLKQRKDVSFVIRGPDEGMRAEVRKLIGNEKDIILLPENRDRSEILKMYQSADIYVLPSYREGLPLTLFEAMASGLPIIATPVNGVPFEIENGKNGYLIKHGNIQSFTDKINYLLDNSKIRKKIAATNVQKAKAYNWDIIAKRTEAIYQKAVGHNL